jgi:hypothetical protein
MVAVRSVSTTQLFLIAAIGLFVCGTAPYATWAVALLCAYVIALAGITTTLTVIGDATRDVGHVGVASSVPTVWLGDVLLACALLAIWARGGRLKVGWLLAAFTLPASILLVTAWGNTPAQWSGLKLYVTAIISFAVGRWLSENLTENAATILACACLVVSVLHFVVVVAQSRGMMVVRGSTEAAKWISEGRMVGLYIHPAVLGKIMFLLLCFLLPLSSCTRKLTRRLAYAAVTLGAVSTLFTLSRANLLAIVVAIVLWVFLSGRATKAVVKVGIIAGAVAIVALNGGLIAALQERQDADPHGGFRGSVLEIGLGQIHRAPLTGTGPNYYNEVVSQYDHSFAAKGFPVHNAFLLVAAELGIPLASLFFVPLIVTIIMVVSRVARRGQVDLQAAAFLSIIPGIIIIAWTGWGLVATEVLPLWFMAFGFLAERNDIFNVTHQPIDDENRPTVKYSPSPT